jgi:hypothetical protein
MGAKHTLGKGEVGGSIPLGSTSFPQRIQQEDWRRNKRHVPRNCIKHRNRTRIAHIIRAISVHGVLLAFPVSSRIPELEMLISKLDAARRQLLAAIHLHWFLVEPIATYQLAANAAEVCDGLLSAVGRIRVKKRIEEVQGWSAKDISIMVNKPRNFAKHADRDPNALIEDLLAQDCDSIILTACIDYCIASGRSPVIVGVFVAWFAAVYPEQMGHFFAEQAEKLFPNLYALSRERQIYAARSCLESPLDPALLHDYRNELTDSWRWNQLKRSGQDFRVE